MEEEVLLLAMELGGLKEGEAGGLSLLCRMAAEELTRMLKNGKTPEDCGELFSCAAAKMALADYWAMQGVGCPGKFTAGDLTVEETKADPALLRRQALRQMAPFLKDPGLFLRGVRA